MTSPELLQATIERFFTDAPTSEATKAEALQAFLQLREALEAGTLRSAEPDPTQLTGWRVNAWVKQGILLGFRLGVHQPMNGCEASGPSALNFIDKHTFPPRRFTPADGIRIVPGGTSVRAGAFLAKGVIMAPPSFVNVGAYVAEDTMIDSHALVGSCAQIGARVHLSAAAQIGGVLEPVNASPVIIEDDVLIGGNTGVYEGTVVRKGAVLAAGTILTRGTPVFDLPNNTVLRAGKDYPDQPLIIPPNAVVVPGSRAIQSSPGKDHGLSVYTPILIKYRDEKTNLSTTLEDLLR